MDRRVTNQDTIIQFQNIQKKALELFIKKNNDYGDAYSVFGIIGIIVRIEDKIRRMIHISKTNIILTEDETLRDTLLDLHNYTVLALMIIDEKS